MLSRSGFRCFAACLPFLLLAACGGKEPQAKANGSAAERPIPVTTRVVQPSAWNDTLQALGTAKARESVTLTAKVSEIVQDVHFESGQQVQAGQVLVTLKGDAAQAALVQAEATYAEAERLYRRQKELADQQLIARARKGHWSCSGVSTARPSARFQHEPPHPHQRGLRRLAKLRG